MIYHCCDERRRDALVDHPGLNGLDSVEVVDDPALPPAQRQRGLRVRFVNPVAGLAAQDLRIDGGVRIKEILVLEVTPGAADPDGEVRTLQLALDRAGDFSRYTLAVVAGGGDATPPGFDPVLSRIDFFFKAACQSDLDCREQSACAPTLRPGIEQGYLARDFESYRRHLLDRIGVLSPGWRDRTPADLGVALVELLAYVGDQLSYQQDAVATEAYLGTARSRVSLRRHARLVDYRVHDGCNARAWVQLQVREDVAGFPLLARPGEVPTRVLTRLPGTEPLLAADSRAAEEALAQRPQVFELLHDTVLHGPHNRLSFYTWGARDCCLPRGAIRATLSGHLADLAVGDVLMLVEAVGASTGLEGDADPLHRHVVRLTGVTLGEDPLGGRFADPPSDDPVPVTEISWGEADALPFALCLSAQDAEGEPLEVGFALGNLVLVDHGMTVGDQVLPEVPAADPLLTPVQTNADRCAPEVVQARHPRYRPRLEQGPLLWAAQFDPVAAATEAVASAPGEARAQLWLRDSDGRPWDAATDLLASGPLDRVFTVEADNEGEVRLRFGDGQHGARPQAGLGFSASYRVGNPADGNVGAEALRHLISADPLLVSDLSDPVIVSLRNWLPARGGAAAETSAEVRAAAPYAFRTQERAVTADDFGVLARRIGGVQRVQATPRWTGSWYTTFVSVDREGGQPVDEAFKSRLDSHLQAFRLAGQDLEIDSPREVPLHVELEVCVAAGQSLDRVRGALLERFHNGIGADGTAGLFHPDNFSFGQRIYLSPLVAAAQATPGVASIRVSRFERYGEADSDGRDAGFLPMERLEIARLDNDPNFPEHGVFNLVLRGIQ